MPGTRGPVPVPTQTSGARDLTNEILRSLNQQQPIHTAETFPQISQAEIKAALDGLANRSMIKYDANNSEEVILTEEGQQICDEGSHEWKVWEAVRSKGSIPVKDLEKVIGPSAKVGKGNAFKLKWIRKDGDALAPIASSVTDNTRKLLQHVSKHHAFPDLEQLKDYQKRKLVTTRKIITYSVRKGPRWALNIPVEVTDITAEMLQDGSWETESFKPYNFSALGEPQNAGALHPLNKVRDEFRKIFFSQDFVEMPTGHFVDSGFWNFDALFVPHNILLEIFKIRSTSPTHLKPVHQAQI